MKNKKLQEKIDSLLTENQGHVISTFLSLKKDPDFIQSEDKFELFAIDFTDEKDNFNSGYLQDVVMFSLPPVNNMKVHEVRLIVLSSTRDSYYIITKRCRAPFHLEINWDTLNCTSIKIEKSSLD